MVYWNRPELIRDYDDELPRPFTTGGPKLKQTWIDKGLRPLYHEAAVEAETLDWNRPELIRDYDVLPEYGAAVDLLIETDLNW